MTRRQAETSALRLARSHRSVRRSPAFGWPQVPALATALALGIAAPALLYFFARPLALLVLAFTIAQALSPLADRLDKHMPRAVAATFLYLAVLLAVLLLLASVAPTLMTETQQFFARAPELLDRLEQWIRSWSPVSGAALREAVLRFLKRVQDVLMRVPLQALNILFDALVVVFLSLYLLIAGPRLKRFVLCVFPERSRRRTSRIMNRMGHSMGGYVRGAAISGVFVGFLTWVALLVVGVEYRKTLALLAAVGEFVPYLGPIVAALPAILVAMSDSTSTAAAVAAIYLALQQLESYVITPNVMRTQTNLHPALVILGLVAGFSVGGLVGALAALPLFAAARVLVLAAAPVMRRRAGADRSHPSAIFRDSDDGPRS